MTVWCSMVASLTGAGRIPGGALFTKGVGDTSALCAEVVLVREFELEEPRSSIWLSAVVAGVNGD
jgi:hypothetical protein